jgi:hypothetical protein
MEALFTLTFWVAAGAINAVLLAVGKIPLSGTPINQTKVWAWGGTFIALGFGVLIGWFTAPPEGLEDSPLNRVLYGLIMGAAAITFRAALKAPIFNKLEGKP